MSGDSFKGEYRDYSDGVLLIEQEHYFSVSDAEFKRFIVRISYYDGGEFGCNISAAWRDGSELANFTYDGPGYFKPGSFTSLTMVCSLRWPRRMLRLAWTFDGASRRCFRCPSSSQSETR